MSLNDMLTTELATPDAASSPIYQINYDTQELGEAGDIIRSLLESCTLDLAPLSLMESVGTQVETLSARVEDLRTELQELRSNQDEATSMVNNDLQAYKDIVSEKFLDEANSNELARDSLQVSLDQHKSLIDRNATDIETETNLNSSRIDSLKLDVRANVESIDAIGIAVIENRTEASDEATALRSDIVSLDSRLSNKITDESERLESKADANSEFARSIEQSVDAEIETIKADVLSIRQDFSDDMLSERQTRMTMDNKISSDVAEMNAFTNDILETKIKDVSSDIAFVESKIDQNFEELKYKESTINTRLAEAEKAAISLGVKLDGEGSLGGGYEADVNTHIPAIPPTLQWGGHANGTHDAITFLADDTGTIGNSISLVFDGIDTVQTVVDDWNTANPTNTCDYITGDGSDVLSATTLNFSEGA